MEDELCEFSVIFCFMEFRALKNFVHECLMAECIRHFPKVLNKKILDLWMKVAGAEIFDIWDFDDTSCISFSYCTCSNFNTHSKLIPSHDVEFLGIQFQRRGYVKRYAPKCSRTIMEDIHAHIN